MVKEKLRELYVNGGKEFTEENLCKILMYLELDLTVKNVEEERLKLITKWFVINFIEEDYDVEDLLDEIDKLCIIEDERFVYTCSGESCESTYGTFKEAFEDLIGSGSYGVIYKHEPFSFDEYKTEYKIFESIVS